MMKVLDAYGAVMRPRLESPSSRSLCLHKGRPMGAETDVFPTAENSPNLSSVLHKSHPSGRRGALAVYAPGG